MLNFGESLVILKNKPFAFFLGSRVFTAMAFQMLAVAVGWQIYDLTDSAFYLGLVGLAQFLPMFLLTLAVGHVADCYDRRMIARSCQWIECAGTVFLAIGSFSGWLTKENILITVMLIGAAKAFEGPAMQALMPGLVSTDLFPQAAAWASSLFQTATILGPALGGLLYGISPTAVYGMVGGLYFGAGILITLIKNGRKPLQRASASLDSLVIGIRFIFNRPVILGAISLDLFAVLFGGATALLPIYARKIIMVGPGGLGLLRSAPAIGALIMSVILAYHPVKKQVGKKMFGAVVIFGIATILFAISTSFVLSLIILIILGAADVISVVIRSSLVQLNTPDEMRGRVSAVNSMFVGTSNQLGEFESGLTAAWFEAVPAVLIGGIGTLMVVFLWMRLFPKLVSADTLEPGKI